MATNWQLIREVMNAAIDSCEHLESIGYTEQHRDLTVDVNGRPVRVFDFLVSAWTMPENMRYEVIRERHDRNVDQRYVPEASRILTAVAAACAELVGAGQIAELDTMMRGMAHWYRAHFDPHVERAIGG